MANNLTNKEFSPRKLIYELIDQQINDGFKPEQICVLADFLRAEPWVYKSNIPSAKLAELLPCPAICQYPNHLDKKQREHKYTYFYGSEVLIRLFRFVLDNPQETLWKIGVLDWLARISDVHGASMDEIMDIKTWLRKRLFKSWAMFMIYLDWKNY